MAATVVTFDDTFVLRQLTDAAVGGRALLKDAWSALHDVDALIQRCVELLKKRRGVSGKDSRPPAFVTEQQLLIRGLAILGHRLCLYRACAMIEKTIEIDWIAHTELEKEKRYRDHITHPVRVTAIGWWFLHRSGGALLNRLARYYMDKTETYRVQHGIDCTGSNWPQIVEFAWLASGLLHDCAFPLQYRLQSGLRLGKGCPDSFGILPGVPCSLSNLANRRALIARLNSSWLADQSLDLGSRIRRSRQANFKHAHALLGGLDHCLALGSNLNNSLQGLIVQLAARAVITHHDKEDDDIESDPLATLLFVSDGLQSWRRPFFHREPSGSNNDACTIRRIEECKEVRLELAKEGFVAVQQMNVSEKNALRKYPYNWRFDKFQKPNVRLEKLIRKQGMLPRITCSQRRCIRPAEFLD